MIIVGKRKILCSNAKKRSISRSRKDGLQVPVARIARFLKVGKYAKRVGAEASVFLADVLEYLATEVLELAGIATRNDKKTRIIRRHIQLAIRFDDKLSQFLRDVTIPNGGVIPNIHNIFLPNKKNCSSKAATTGGQEEEED